MIRILHPQNQNHKNKLLSEPFWICLERAEHYTDSYKKTENEHPAIRSAKAFASTFEKMSIRIEPGELLIGNRSSHLIAPPFAPEKGDLNYVLKALLPDLEKFGYNITKDQKDRLFHKILPYWDGKTVRDQKVAEFKKQSLDEPINLSFKEIKRKIQAFGIKKIISILPNEDENNPSKIMKITNFSKQLVSLPRLLGAVKGGTADNVKGRGRCIDTQAHIVLGHKNILKLGFKGIQVSAQERLKLVTDNNQKCYLQSIEIVCEAIRALSLRFALLAEHMASLENDPVRKKELLSISDVCRKVPWEPPTNFYEAIQAIWFAQNAAIISYGAGSGITPGRIDQLLFPYFEQDLKNQIIDKPQILRLMEEFIIKINNNVVVWPNLAGVKLNHFGSDIENITIGGVGRNGEDATNELSFLIIQALKNTKMATSASFRISKKSSNEFLKEILMLNRETGSPAFFNDEITIKMMMNDGYSLEDARDYCLVGCAEPSDNGKTYGATGGTKVYLPVALDFVFNGSTTFFGNKSSVITKDPRLMVSFEEFLQAYYDHLDEMVRNVAKATNIRNAIWAKHYPNPFISCTIDGCIENARDMTDGGAIYNFGAIGGGGLATIVDSLAAIKKFVFEEHKVSMSELIETLQRNYRNKEPLRQLLSHGPKFGTDEDYVDTIAKDLVDHFCKIVSQQKLSRKGHYKASLISYGLNIYEGMLEPATPNGRKAGEPLSNSISPSNGAETKGITAMFKSLAKIDHTKIGFGDSLNVKYPAYLLSTDKGIDILKTLIQVYFDLGGYHVQINTANANLLKDAQLHPEAYADLIVRVSGYSAYFTQLGTDIQQDIIDRIEFCTSC